MAHKIINAFDNIVIAVIALLLIAFIALKAAGFQFFVVMSGSMEPVLPVGSVVLVEPTPYNEIQVGDDISFVVGEEKVTVTHRVVEKDEGANTLTTKGVANNVSDDPIPASAVIGKVIFDIPLVGRLLYFLSSLQGKIVAGIVVVAWVIITMLIKQLEKSE